MAGKFSGKVVTRIKLTRPDELLETSENVTYNSDEQLDQYCKFIIATARRDGGVTEQIAPFKTKFIPIERFEDMTVEGIPSLISTDGNMGDAIAEAAASRKRDEALRGGLITA